MPLDANALLTAAQQGATINAQEGWVQNLNQAAIQTQLANYQTQLQNYINSTPSGSNSTVGDVIGKKIIAQSVPSLLAGVTPNTIMVQTSQASAIPSNLQHKFTYGLYASDTDQANGNALLSYTEKTSKLVGKRLTITYVPATQADADTIASYLPQPHADGSSIQPSELPGSLPGYLIHLKAQINLGNGNRRTSDRRHPCRHFVGMVLQCGKAKPCLPEAVGVVESFGLSYGLVHSIAAATISWGVKRARDRRFPRNITSQASTKCVYSSS